MKTHTSEKDNKLEIGGSVGIFSPDASFDFAGNPLPTGSN